MSLEATLRQIAAIVSGCDHNPRRNMHFIDPKTIPASSWVADNETQNQWLLKAVDSICPHCHKAVAISLNALVLLPGIQSAAMLGRCPRCQESKKIKVFFTDVKSIHDVDKTKVCSGIWLEPAPKVRSLLISSLPEKRIFNAYKDAIEAFNVGMWSSAITSCGRIIEGIGKTTFPNAEKTNQIKGLFDKLGSELKKAPDFKELLDPLLNLGDALRVGRNPGSHFDLEIEPSRDLADKVIDLTEFLIKYIYLISQEIVEVNRLIAEARPGDEDEASELDSA